MVNGKWYMVQGQSSGETAGENQLISVYMDYQFFSELIECSLESEDCVQLCNVVNSCVRDLYR